MSSAIRTVVETVFFEISFVRSFVHSFTSRGAWKLLVLLCSSEKMDWLQTKHTTGEGKSYASVADCWYGFGHAVGEENERHRATSCFACSQWLFSWICTRFYVGAENHSSVAVCEPCLLTTN